MREALKAQLHDGGEIALLDAREEVPFGRRHLLMASCVPLSRLELLVDDLVPRRGARVVWCDDGDGSAARAAARMAALGYQDVAVLDGGIAAWEAAGYRVYSGVHVPSKAFAEVVEHEAGTPWISRPELKALIDSGADIAIFDSRSYEEYHNNSIPTRDQRARGRAGLSLRRSGAVAGHHGHRQLRRPHAQHHRRAVADQRRLPQQDHVAEGRHDGLASGRVRGRARRDAPAARGVSAHGRAGGAEAAARVGGALRHPRASTRRRSPPGGPRPTRAPSTCSTSARRRNTRPAICAARARRPADSSCRKPTAHIATWGARVVLVDDNGVRATMTASWLKQMGWHDVAVLVAGPADGDWVTGRHVPRVLGLDGDLSAGYRCDGPARPVGGDGRRRREHGIGDNRHGDFHRTFWPDGRDDDTIPGNESRERAPATCSRPSNRPSVGDDFPANSASAIV